ncbi:serine hydrolase domain-containing protein [Nonomuraea roseoviolacea]|uniref:D-alanyl-D-alanine carboxypeptidase n=1 Tax=Nonomuraea roseoviolacea subsp. carminata TaxID=160689 RepID=A0ABT1K2C3_9ACTN|nr:serine hydrolase domain-containing protein [Nonomuraea roseoviolacea]MCP2347631.1 D-alanyl-D-alanine carboxypeptidase [Nonomuraea roseoviolacea subsp. carminata]
MATTFPRPTVQQALDRAVTERRLPGILAIVRDGEDARFGTAGVADTGTGERRRPEERFRVGSITKTFTATVVLQLAAEDKLSLDDTVDAWLPGLVSGNGHDGRAITVRQLLNMTSGISNYSLDPDMLRRYYGPAFLKHRYDHHTPEQLVRTAMSHAPDFAPGQGWTYTNTGYVLAGMIIERVTGETFAEQVSRRVVRPLGLTGTYVPGDEVGIHGPHARHYSTNYAPDADAEVHDVTDMNVSVGWAAGGMVSHAADLDRFFTALLKGELLPRAQHEEMFAAEPTPEGKWIPGTPAYGLGMSSLRLPGGRTVWGMGGAINGSFSFAYGTRDGERMVVQNVNGDWNDPISLFMGVLEAEFGPAD